MEALIQDALGKVQAKLKEKGKTNYWLASRIFQKNLYSFNGVYFALKGLRTMNDRMYVIIMQELESEE